MEDMEEKKSIQNVWQTQSQSTHQYPRILR